MMYMKYLIFLSAFILTVSPTQAHCDILSLNRLSIEGMQAQPGSVDPLTDYNGLKGRTLNQELNLQMDLVLVGPVYLNNRIRALTDRGTDGGSGQFRSVGWNWRVGVHVLPALDIFVDHFSQHVLDTGYAPGHFPLEDSVGFRLNLFKSKTEEKALFQ